MSGGPDVRHVIVKGDTVVGDCVMGDGAILLIQGMIYVPATHVATTLSTDGNEEPAAIVLRLGGHIGGFYAKLPADAVEAMIADLQGKVDKVNALAADKAQAALQRAAGKDPR